VWRTTRSINTRAIARRTTSAVSGVYKWNNLTPRIGITPVCALKAAAVPVGGGETETNRQGYHQRYLGFEFSATKRMSNHWMARFGFSTNDWREYFDDPSVSIIDPTKAPAPAITQARQFAGPQIDGGLVVRRRRAAARATSTSSRRHISSWPMARTKDPGASTSAPTW
jgi:hypothetical protein